MWHPKIIYTLVKRQIHLGRSVIIFEKKNIKISKKKPKRRKEIKILFKKKQNFDRIGGTLAMVNFTKISLFSLSVCTLSPCSRLSWIDSSRQECRESQATLVRDSRQMHEARVYSRHNLIHRFHPVDYLIYWRLPMHATLFCSWIEVVNPTLITGNHMSHHIRLILNFSQPLATNFNSVVSLFSSQEMRNPANCDSPHFSLLEQNYVDRRFRNM